MIKTVLILAGVIVLLLVVAGIFFKFWRKSCEKYQAEHERAERLRTRLETALAQEQIHKEVYDEAIQEKSEVDKLSGRAKYDAITNKLRNN